MFIQVFLNKYTYNNIIFYIVELSSMFKRLFINIVLRLRLIYLIVESKLKLELGSYAT